MPKDSENRPQGIQEITIHNGDILEIIINGNRYGVFGKPNEFFIRPLDGECANNPDDLYKDGELFVFVNQKGEEVKLVAEKIPDWKFDPVLDAAV